MNTKRLPNWIFYTIQVACFTVTVALVYLLMPHTGRIDRYFEVGKPWAYEVLMAPFDFPIYKTDATLAVERDSALRNLTPFYNIDASIGEKQLALFDATQAKINSRTKQHIAALLSEIYAQGIISTDQMLQLQQWRSTDIEIVDANKVAHTQKASGLYTPKSAYDHIMRSVGDQWWIKEENVSDLGLDQFIKPNLTLDKTKTDHAIAEITDAILLTSGMIQRGERIIDRGEVVTPTTYQILVSLQRSNDGNLDIADSDYWNVIGDVLIVVIIYLLLFIYFYMFRSKILHSLKEIVFMQAMSLIMLATLSLCINYDINIYIVPFAMLPIVVRVFFDSRTALYLHNVTILVASQMVPNPMEFTLLQILAGMIAISSLKDLNSRSQLAKSALLVLVGYIVIYTVLQLSHGIKPADINYWTYLTFTLNAVAIMFAYVLIFIVEKLFGFLSSMTLVELSNINNPLLMEFSEKCPGTFQHVLQVSNLSVEVAKRIDANALLVRTGALYHDLGKMTNPMYYTENQFSGFNPLNEMSYEEAAQIIISHVTDGIRAAEHARLPRPIIRFIASHHGTSKTRYFYNSFKNKYPDREIDEAAFTYPGPLPATKEEAVLMMTDAIEAASRSLKTYDAENIDRMVEGIINGQIADGQFRNAPLSFRDVEVAKSVFKDKLQNIYHTRISYPELKKNTPDTTLESPILNKLRKAKHTLKP